MKTLCQNQLPFTFYSKPTVVVNFKGGQITSDAGLMTLREFDKRWRLTEQMDACIDDRRCQNLIHHQPLEMLRQRLYQIIAGYEDADDCDLLREDPTMKLMASKGDLAQPLASQPTISRLENMVGWEEIESLSGLLLRWFMKTRSRPPKEVILDLDSTDDPAHGAQQLVLFNGFYDQYMYHPLLLFEGRSGHLLSVLLRRGVAPSSECAGEMLKTVISKLKKKFPCTSLFLRGDAGFGVPELYDLCEKAGVGYALGIKANSVLKRKAQKALTRARGRYRRTGKAARWFTSFWYRARSWKRRRRVCIKAECNSEGTNLRFLVTTLKGRSREVFTLHNGRGECENRIKEFKRGFSSDRLSCHTYLANAFRLVLHGLGYNLVNLFREKTLGGTELAKAQIDTLRGKLFKVGAWVRQTTRRVWVKLASGWPYRNLFRQVYVALMRQAPPLRC